MAKDNNLSLYGQSLTIYLTVYDQNGQFLQDTISWASGDVKISKDHGNFANTTNLPTIVGGTGSKIWQLVLTAAEMQCAQWCVQIKDQDGPVFAEDTAEGLTYGNASAQIPSIPATLASGAIASAELNNISDDILKRDWTSVTGEAARSTLNALRFLRNKWSVSGNTLTVTEEDDSTSAWTGTITTNASADPITGNDPA